MLQPFDPRVKTVVLTDVSRLHGIGFALVQVYKDKLVLIQCGCYTPATRNSQELTKLPYNCTTGQI